MDFPAVTLHQSFGHPCSFLSSGYPLNLHNRLKAAGEGYGERATSRSRRAFTVWKVAAMSNSSNPLTAYLLDKRDIPALVALLSKELEVYGPVAHGPTFRFEAIEDPTQLRLDYDTTILPPKKYFIPPVQKVLSFSLSPSLQIRDAAAEAGKDGQLGEEHQWHGKRFILFGVHPCDLAAITFNDKIHSRVYPDPYRERRRRESIIVGLHCLEPCPDSFCRSMGTLNWEEGADLMLTELDGAYLVQVRSEAGRMVTEAAGRLIQPASSGDLERARRLLEEREKRFPDPLGDPSELPECLESCYESRMWDRLGRRCFGCGSCTMVCPTCFCFDVQDRVDLSLDGGVRLRRWDSCQLVDFALVAGGHNFRPTIASRIRFRIYHKFRAEPEQVGQIGCVGCGRCTRACPADIDMVEVLKDIKEGRQLENEYGRF